MYIASHQITGTDLPVYEAMEIQHYTLMELTMLNEDPSQYKHVGFYRTSKNLYVKVYEKKGSIV